MLFNHPFIYTTYVYTQSSTHTCKSYISTVSIWHIIARTSLIFRYLPLRRRLCNERWVVLGEADKCWQKLSIVPLQAGKDEYTATDWARHDWKHLRNSCKTQGWSGKTSNANKKNKSETNLIGNPPWVGSENWAGFCLHTSGSSVTTRAAARIYLLKPCKIHPTKAHLAKAKPANFSPPHWVPSGRKWKLNQQLPIIRELSDTPVVPGARGHLHGHPPPQQMPEAADGWKDGVSILFWSRIWAGKDSDALALLRSDVGALNTRWFDSTHLSLSPPKDVKRWIKTDLVPSLIMQF